MWLIETIVVWHFCNLKSDTLFAAYFFSFIKILGRMSWTWGSRRLVGEKIGTGQSARRVKIEKYLSLGFKTILARNMHLFCLTISNTAHFYKAQNSLNVTCTTSQYTRSRALDLPRQLLFSCNTRLKLIAFLPKMPEPWDRPTSRRQKKNIFHDIP